MLAREIVERLEAMWDNGMFFESVREGKFTAGDGDELIEILRSLAEIEDDVVPKRLLSMIWYVPLFLEWQKRRVLENSQAASRDYNRFVTEVINTMETAIGVP